MGFTPTDLENALEALGTLLASRGHTAEIAVIGGGSLLLMGLIQRATKDLDVVAVVEQGAMRGGKNSQRRRRGASRTIRPTGSR